MPAYKPQQQVSGTIRIRGDEHQGVMLRNWENDFHRYQPDILFDDRLTSTVHGILALVFDAADLGLLGREIAPLENLSFRRKFRYDPLEITIATGSYDTPFGVTFIDGYRANECYCRENFQRKNRQREPTGNRYGSHYAIRLPSHNR
jgi:hypothetical protein